MKKILYTLFAVSLLAVACTTEVPVTRDHDIDAEVTDLQTKMEMTTLYCNLNESELVDLQKLSEYLTEKDADVVMFVAPTSVNGTDFKVWLDAYAAENGGLTVLESRNANNVLTMAALVKPQWLLETYNVTESSVTHHFRAFRIQNTYHRAVKFRQHFTGVRLLLHDPQFGLFHLDLKFQILDFFLLGVLHRRDLRGGETGVPLHTGIHRGRFRNHDLIESKPEGNHGFPRFIHSMQTHQLHAVFQVEQ